VTSLSQYIDYQWLVPAAGLEPAHPSRDKGF
jgi:hypothetical protein